VSRRPLCRSQARPASRSDCHRNLRNAPVRPGSAEFRYKGLRPRGGAAGSRAAPITESASAALQVERDAVHAPPLPAGLARTVVEDVAEMGVAARAAHLGADHPVRAVLDQFDGVR
jgi:hypothetical protein